MNKLHVWLAYVANPITTAAYFERALRQYCRTTTIGPTLPPELVEMWGLHDLKIPLKNHDISTFPNQDLRLIVADTNLTDHPDLLLWIESVGGDFPLHMEALTCPKACYLVDTHHKLSMHLEWAKQFDMVFIAQREYLGEFKKLGMKAYWLPLGCDPDVHCSTNLPKIHQIGFVGGIPLGSRRDTLLKKLSDQIPVHYERCFWDDMAQLYSQSKIVFNESVKDDLNMRVFEAMSTGTLLLTDMAKNSGQSELFKDGEDYAVYHDENICDVARFYLDNENLREQIAMRGQRLVHSAHTYRHRTEDLIAVALGGKEDTFSAAELRAQSLAGIPDIDADIQVFSHISKASRSFIIPVLDMSPASEYNILTLLEDLKEIEGDVIVIFNGTKIGEELKEHPRITRYAIMKQNIGVARAWNLGLEIAVTPIAFILNADLHVKRSSIYTLEQALLQLPEAACVGPQGSFVEYSLARDYTHFDKGTFDTPLEVDAVSGFFFAIKLRYFNEKIIRFENGFTPCYFEEWDLGLQVKRAGLKNYIVPTSAYDHHWSGSIRALREIVFYEKSETAGDILLRNRQLFLNKWRGIADKENNGRLLESGFLEYVMRCSQTLVDNEQFEDALRWLDNASIRFHNNSELTALKRFVYIQSRKTAESLRKTSEVVH